MIEKLLLAIFLFTFSAFAVPAQKNPEQAIQNARDRFSEIKNRSIELERMKREAYKKPVGENFTRKFPEIKKDFEKIQTLNNELLRLTAGKNSLNYVDVLKFVSEVNERAARLWSNLFPGEPKHKKEAQNKHQNAAESKEVKKLLYALDKSINNFVHNSIFQNINVVNSADLLKAQEDLEIVIGVSNAIKLKTKN